MSNCKNSVFQVGPRPHKDKKKLPQIETRETQYSPVVGNSLQDQAANLFQDFVSLHEKYESESESRSTVRVVHVATQEVQASLDATAKVPKEYRKYHKPVAVSARATENLVPRSELSQQTKGEQGCLAATKVWGKSNKGKGSFFY